jgi:hypothetical protein
MTQKLYKVGKIILGWIVVNALGVAAIAVVVSIFPFLTSIHGMLMSSLVIGLPIGFAQWIGLRRVAPISILWVLTASAGLVLGLVVVNSPIADIWGFLDEESALSLTAAYTTIGLLIGLAQWLLLESHFTRALVWPLSSAVGLGLGCGLVLATDLVYQSEVVSIILVFLMYTIATGLTKAWLPASYRATESNLANRAQQVDEPDADIS